jgi:hypothetical protein
MPGAGGSGFDALSPRALTGAHRAGPRRAARTDGAPRHDHGARPPPPPRRAPAPPQRSDRGPLARQEAGLLLAHHALAAARAPELLAAGAAGACLAVLDGCAGSGAEATVAAGGSSPLVRLRGSRRPRYALRAPPRAGHAVCWPDKRAGTPTYIRRAHAGILLQLARHGDPAVCEGIARSKGAGAALHRRLGVAGDEAGRAAGQLLALLAAEPAVSRLGGPPARARVGALAFCRVVRCRRPRPAVLAPPALTMPRAPAAARHSAGRQSRSALFRGLEGGPPWRAYAAALGGAVCHDNVRSVAAVVRSLVVQVRGPIVVPTQGPWWLHCPRRCPQKRPGWERVGASERDSPAACASVGNRHPFLGLPPPPLARAQRPELSAAGSAAGLLEALLSAMRRHKSEAAVGAAAEALRSMLDGAGLEAGANRRRLLALPGALCERRGWCRTLSWDGSVLQAAAAHTPAAWHPRNAPAGSVQALADLLGPPPASVVAWEQRTYAHILQPPGRLSAQQQQQQQQQQADRQAQQPTQQQAAPGQLPAHSLQRTKSTARRPTGLNAAAFHDGMRESGARAAAARRVALQVEGPAAAVAGAEGGGSLGGDDPKLVRRRACVPAFCTNKASLGGPARCVARAPHPCAAARCALLHSRRACFAPPLSLPRALQDVLAPAGVARRAERAVPGRRPVALCRRGAPAQGAGGGRACLWDMPSCARLWGHACHSAIHSPPAPQNNAAPH